MLLLLVFYVSRHLLFQGSFTLGVDVVLVVVYFLLFYFHGNGIIYLPRPPLTPWTPLLCVVTTLGVVVQVDFFLLDEV